MNFARSHPFLSWLAAFVVSFPFFMVFVLVLLYFVHTAPLLYATALISIKLHMICPRLRGSEARGGLHYEQ